MKDTIKFSQFLKRFPTVELPIIFTEEAQRAFSSENDPLPDQMIAQFLVPIEEEVIDEFTEFVPCCKIPKTDGFHAIVYWRAGLMNYQYVMATFDKKGNFLHRRVIAGTFSDGKEITYSVATVDPDWTIYVVSGQQKSNHSTYDPQSSRAFELELLADGQITRLEEA